MMTKRTQLTVSPKRGFTLLELMLSLAIIAVLVTMMFALVGGLRKRAESAACMANMKTLFAGLGSYTMEYRHWPQPPIDSLGEEDKFWEFWFGILEEYDVRKETWICPTYARLSAVEDEEDKKGTYLPTGFDASSPRTPYKFANQPWLMEIGNHHGKGPLVIYPDGSIRPFSIVAKGDVIK